MHKTGDSTISLRERAHELIAKLQKAVDEIQTLRGILPICSFCKRIRDDTGYWEQVESYFTKHSEAAFSHGICPTCVKIHYPEYSADEVIGEPQR